MLEAHVLFVDHHLAEIATKCAEVFDVVGLEIYFSFCKLLVVSFLSKCVDFHGGGFKQAPCGDGGGDNDVWTSCDQSAHGEGQGGQAPWEENLVLTWYM